MKKLKKLIVLSLSVLTILTGAVLTFAQDIKGNINYDELSHTYSNF